MIETKFKHTEVGIIPEEWDITTIDDITKKCNNAFVDGPFGSNLKSVHFVKHGDVYVIESSCVTTGSFIAKDFKTITQEHFETISRSECKQGDVIIAKIGMNCGMCAELPLLDKRSVVSGNSMKITIEQDKMLNCIFINYMNIAKKQGRFSGLISESAQPALSLRTLKPFYLALPTTGEQARIAKALSDIDNLIFAMRQLIKKKKNIKQGAMDHLLSGKRRIKGFKEEWVDILLKEFKPQKGTQINKNSLDIDSLGYPVMNGGISPSGYNSEYNSEANTIIISEGGNSCGYVNFMNKRFWAGGHCYTLSIPESMCIGYIYQTLKYYEPQIMALRTGSGLPNIKKSTLCEFKITIPSQKEEQEAIATVLADMDGEIEHLESQLSKYEGIKTGMMQQLLTGKIRLI